jgi:hypothetical protein
LETARREKAKNKGGKITSGRSSQKEQRLRQKKEQRRVRTQKKVRTLATLTLQGRSEQRAKFHEEVFEFTNSAWREYDEELHYDAISGEVMVKELAEAARKVTMEMLMEHGVYEKVPTEECWVSIGKAPVGSSGLTRAMASRRILSTDAGWWRRRSRRTSGRICSEQCHRWRRRRRRSRFGQVCQGCSDFRDAGRAYIRAQARRKVYLELLTEDFDQG